METVKKPKISKEERERLRQERLKIYDKEVDIHKQNIFFNRTRLDLIDQNIVTKPVIDSLARIAASEKIEKGQTTRIDLRERTEQNSRLLTELGSSLERSQNGTALARVRKPRAIFDLMGTNNVEKIEKMLENNTGT